MGMSIHVRVIGHGLGSRQLERQIGPILRDRRQNKPVPRRRVRRGSQSPIAPAPGRRLPRQASGPPRASRPRSASYHPFASKRMHAHEQRLVSADGSVTLAKSLKLLTIQAFRRRRFRLTLTTFAGPPEKALNHGRYVLVNRRGAAFGRANPTVAADADSHAYAYSASPDKATKATLADKMTPGRALSGHHCLDGAARTLARVASRRFRLRTGRE